MGFDVKDNALHVSGGALIAAPMLLWPSIVSTFFAFAVWGLLREQAQKHARGASFEYNWIDYWSGHKVVEGLMWGVGASVAHLVINILR